jgi:uncharacterized Fe-S center protein
MKCGILINHVSSNDDSALKLTEDEKGDWHSLPSLGVQSEDCPTCDTAVKICELQNVNQVLDQHLIKPEKPKLKRKLKNTKQQS